MTCRKLSLCLQGLLQDVVTKHCILEEISQISASLLDGSTEKQAVDLKSEVCKLSEEWDKIYQESKDREKFVRKSLMYWYSYVEKVEHLKAWFDDMKYQISVKAVPCEEPRALDELLAVLRVSISIC